MDDSFSLTTTSTDCRLLQNKGKELNILCINDQVSGPGMFLELHLIEQKLSFKRLFFHTRFLD